MANYWGVSGALGAGANPVALFLGDSWFWYPLDNLVVETSAAFFDKDFVVIGRNGSEAAEWATKGRKEIEFAFRMYAAGVQALVLSGGGNDIAGTSDFLRILADDCSKATEVAQCYRPGQPGVIVDSIISACRGVVLKFRAYNSSATVFLHNYDHAWPTGKGVFGPGDWLKVPMDRAKVPKGLRRPLLKDLLKQLRKAQLALAKEQALGPLVAIASAGTMPDDDGNKDQWWANELHPTPAGFKLLAKKAFTPALQQAITA
jgi:hypothetical protein